MSFARHLVIVRNIPWTVSPFEFKNHFSSFGDVKHAEIFFNHFGLSTGNGMVEFYDHKVWDQVIKTNHYLESMKLKVDKGSADEIKLYSQQIL